MDRQIRLSIAVQVELPEVDGAGNRAFEDAGFDHNALPRDGLGQSNVHAHDFHGCSLILQGGEVLQIL
jgi:hypothetical protein